jgi:CubicO group peptidase (beta-lactamase class C family)
MLKPTYKILLAILFISCSTDHNPTTNNPETDYFPPIKGTAWETQSVTGLQWNLNAVQPLLDYLEQSNSKSFIILVNGRIVIEKYFNDHNATKNWYWASAGKTLTSTMVGIAQQENLLNINHKVSQYLGTGWTSETPEKENMITCKHLLSMTSGLDDSTENIAPSDLIYKADAGTRWAYQNVYVKLQDIVANAAGTPWENYFNAKLRDKIGMNGNWVQLGAHSVFTSNSRSMARFGLLMLHKGKWGNTTILNETYFDEATTTSQSINLGYGYLWWLNGKTSYHLPQSQLTFQGSIIPTAPNDMFMALGKNDQKIYVVPSKKMVIIRMGDAAQNDTLALSDFDKTLWEKINALYE